MAAIEIHSICKSYGTVEALHGVSLTVERGELFGLIGPDGAGKTTLFRILATLINADQGSAMIESLDVQRDYRLIRQQVGYMPGRFSLYPDLSVEENIFFFASLFGTTVEANYDLIEPIYRQIEPFRTRRAGKLSGGMKQKLALCCALIHRPKVLLLDEPTTGVDAVSRSEFWDMLQTLCGQGITIMVSTPYMDEASRCTNIALINNGRLLCTDTPDHITSRLTTPLYLLKGGDMFRLLHAVRSMPDVLSCYAFGDALHLTVSPAFQPSVLTEMLRKEDLGETSITLSKPSIEDVFIQLTQS